MTRKLIRLALSAQLIAILVACLALSGFTSCSITNPIQAQSQLTRVSKASKSIAQYTGEAISLVRTSYENGLIKLEVKDKIAGALKQFSVDGKSFNDLVASLVKQYSAGTLPPNVWALVVQSFDQLTKTFVDIVSSIPAAAGLADSKAFKIITAAVVTIAQVLISVGANVMPSWRAIERAAPNWRDTLPLFNKEVLGELA